MTTGDLIKRSLRLVGAIASGETPSGSEAADALETLNGMLNSWSTQDWLITKSTREVFLTEVGKAEYTIGPEGDWDTSRPTKILRAKYTDPEIITNIITPYDPGDPLADPPVPETEEVTETIIKATNEYPMEILTFEKWQRIYDKRMTSTVPSGLYVVGTAPLETVQIYPVPSSVKGIVLYSNKALSSFATLAEDFELQPGYEDAVVYNLAARLGIEYGKQLDPLVYDLASKGLALVKRSNMKTSLMKSDVAGINCNGGFNILTGE